MLIPLFSPFALFKLLKLLVGHAIVVVSFNFASYLMSIIHRFSPVYNHFTIYHLPLCQSLLSNLHVRL